MKKELMYALCLNDKCTDLEKGREYRVLRVKSYSKFGDTHFYILENKKAYSGIHFSVTYLK